MGASILSFVELIELMVEILNYFRHKCLKEKTAVEKKRTYIPVKPVRMSRVKKRLFRVSKIGSEVNCVKFSHLEGWVFKKVPYLL